MTFTQVDKMLDTNNSFFQNLTLAQMITLYLNCFMGSYYLVTPIVDKN